MLASLASVAEMVSGGTSTFNEQGALVCIGCFIFINNYNIL